MKPYLFFFLSFLWIGANAQYYYKDIIGAKETAELIRTYRNTKVSRVLLSSYDAENTKSDDFYVEQLFSTTNNALKTITRSGVTGQSVLTSLADASGNVIQTLDSNETSNSITTYNYNTEGVLNSVISTTSDTARSFNQTEEHLWEYDNGRAARMLRIKDKKDTSIIRFKLDEKGNVSEEQSTRRGIASDPVYYYYDSNNRLTDIVRFNTKAKRLLPEYMFEYSPTNQVIQKITVPGNGSNYLIWRYQYDNRGLRIREAIFDKYKQLSGKIEYQYQFGF